MLCRIRLCSLADPCTLLVRVATSPKSTLQATKGKDTLDILADEEFSGMSHTQKELEEFDAEELPPDPEEQT